MQIYQKVLIVVAVTLQLASDHLATSQQLNDSETEIKIIRIKPAVLPLDNRFNESTTNNDIIKTDHFEAPLIVIKPIKPVYNPSIKNKQQLTGDHQSLPKPKRRRIKKLKFMYEMKDGDDNKFPRITRVHIAPGAYPVFYGIAKVNGHFKENQIKSFTPEEYGQISK